MDCKVLFFFQTDLFLYFIFGMSSIIFILTDIYLELVVLFVFVDLPSSHFLILALMDFSFCIWVHLEPALIMTCEGIRFESRLPGPLTP